MFYNQLEKLCLQHGITPSSVTQLLGMSKGTMSNWKKGGTPNGDAVVRFSEHFNVSTDYLLKGVESIRALPNNDQEWLDLVHQLPVEAQLEFKGELRGYIKHMNQSASTERLLPTGTDKPGK